jgi:hypothetical protein
VYRQRCRHRPLLKAAKRSTCFARNRTTSRTEIEKLHLYNKVWHTFLFRVSRRSKHVVCQLLLEAFQHVVHTSFIAFEQLPAMATPLLVHLPNPVPASSLLSPAQRIVVQPLRESDADSDHERGWPSLLAPGAVARADPNRLPSIPSGTVAADADAPSCGVDWRSAEGADEAGANVSHSVATAVGHDAGFCRAGGVPFRPMEGPAKYGRAFSRRR